MIPKDYLQAAKLMTLATVDDGRPYACTVYYSFDDEALYFVSHRDRNHSQHVLRDGNVAASIVSGTFDWTDEKKGLQIEGECHPCPQDEVHAAFATYVERFPAASSIQDAVGDPDSHHILWKLIPRRVKIWDETEHGSDGKVISK